ncbi:protein Aster-B isoform X4 [Esox lucius]|uniref:protein Aster-B isoform X4 n=1 Tax=Esox lucius TaxID=8010 RepID=UPI0009732515|nr:protein Aster-B isoform X4 [Esox lucius]
MSQLLVGQKIMTETLRLPSFQVQAPGDWEPQNGDPGSGGPAGMEKLELRSGAGDPSALSSSATPSLRRKRFKMRRMKNVQSESGMTPAESVPAAAARSEVMSKGQGSHSFSGAMEYLQLPSIEITPSSDEDTAANWSSCSTPSASPRRKRFLLRRWLNVREKKEPSSDSRENSLHSSHEEDPARFLTPHSREESTASNSNRSTPACSPVLRHRSRSPTPQQSLEPSGENMVEKGHLDPPSDKDKSPSTPEQVVQRTYSQSVHSATRSHGGKNSKKSQSWYNVLSPTYKQRNEDFRKLFKQLPDSERLIVDYSCALQRDILLQGRLYVSENWICFYSNIFRWETLLTVRLKDICSMTKEKTARLIPNAIQLCTDNDKHFFTSFGARDRTYMMMFRLWQNALLEKPLCPKELWHFVHQCYGNELGLTSDDEDYVPPDDDFNTMGYCEELPVEENDANDAATLAKSPDAKGDTSPLLSPRAFPNNALPCPGALDPLLPFDLANVDEFSVCLPDGEVLSLPLPRLDNQSSGHSSPAASPSLDFNDNEDLPTELSDSSGTHDEGEVQAFHEDLNGRQYINEVYQFSVDKLYDILFTESTFMRDFLEQRRFSDVVYHPWKKDKEETGNQTREIMYTISLTNPLAPKTATVTETQTLYKASQESECYIIDAEVIAHDVPYHDYFYTLNRYMLTRVAKNKCRLRVSTELRYKKQPWGLVKGFIERNFWSGLDEYFRHLELELSKVEAVLAESHRQSPKARALRAGALRRRKRPLVHLRPPHLDEALSPVTTPEDEEEVTHCHRIKHVAGSTQTRHIPDHVPGGLALYSVSKLLLIISFVICISLVLLVFLNMMLFYKLWMLEYTTQSLTSWHGLRPQESKLPQTQLEWAQLLESQQRYHDDELQKWKEIIKSSVMLLDEMKDSLLKLQKGIGLRDYNPESEEKRSRYH